MTKKIGARVRVVESSTSLPSRFYWSDRWRQIAQVIDHWRESGEWWDGEEDKDYYLITSAGGGCYELCREAPGQWLLSRVLD
ncbi:MAG TPA: hypothetical protein DDZ84_00970 [Firmicutes bacterium]|jgi:hypothetical protein|nr:hypothetical protein [Bacillota bacterium]